MTVEQLTALVIALGSAPVVLKLIDWAKATRSGRANAEKQRNRNALGRLVEAEEKAEDEATYRRIIQEYASELRRLLIDWGYPKERLPDYPVRPVRDKV